MEDFKMEHLVIYFSMTLHWERFRPYWSDHDVILISADYQPTRY